VTLRAPSRLTLLTIALLLLLPALAALQYKWVGQLSDGERERMQRNMRTAAAQFRDAFDGEVARAFIGLQVDGALARDEAWDRYAERYAAWAATATHPALVATVFLVDAVDAHVRLRRWDATSRRFEPASWEGSLADAQSDFEEQLRAYRAGTPLLPRDRAPWRDDSSLLVAPLVSIHVGTIGVDARQPLVSVFGYTVLQLNMPYVRDQLLPALTARHFSHTDGAGYRAAVVDAADPKKIIYRSSPEAPVDPARADASEPLFGTHGDPVMFLARGAARQVHERNLFVSVARANADRDATVRMRLFDSGLSRWRLLLQHERGSLEAAVAGMRQRNLLVSFGILLLMGVSIGLLSLSSRRAQRLARQQMEFVAGVSHELRTPVAVIRSAADNLSHGVVGDPDRVRRYGDTIQAEARRLGEMLERVLHFAGIESGRAGSRAPVDVAAIIDEAIDAVTAADEGLLVDRQIGESVPPVLGDAAALRSAIQNLVVNAAKYGGDDRWIGVRVDLVGSGGAREVRVRVEDHGRGIAAADLPHVFEPFYRGADAVARQVHGSGLGLALVRRIAEAHGGRVTVTTAASGTIFALHLPAAAVKPTPTEAFTEAVAR
jgi:signal transduction histidine kinase